MARTLTSAQEALVNAAATKPIVIGEIAHSGTVELLSASGRVVYDEKVYSAGGFNLSRIRNSEEATIVLPFTPERVAQVHNGTWRGGICKIILILADPAVEEDYTEDDGIVLLYGEIVSSRFSNSQIQVQANHVFANSKVSPRHTYNRVVPVIPSAGKSITWEGQTVTLRPAR